MLLATPTGGLTTFTDAGGGGDSLGERNFMAVSSFAGASGGECEDDLLFEECFLAITGESFFEVLGELDR